MYEFLFKSSNPLSQFLEIELKLPISQSGEVQLQLPSWRAGRYQFANYAQNIRKISLSDQHGKSIQLRKKSKDCWAFDAKVNQTYFLNYEYYAGKMDAGSCWVDDQQLYINFVNCCFEVKSSDDFPYSIEIQDSRFKDFVCTLSRKSGGQFLADSFQELADSTFLTSEKLTHWEYESNHAQFHIWINGEIAFSKTELLQAFKNFTDKLIADFGEFPEKEYHFIFQLLPYKHFHGVEHKKGTVITFGPAQELSNPEQFGDLMGVSCHEMYHAWNVCRIRPQELLPYDFSKENYSEAGWILEGITTYMGDLYLLKSGFFNLDEYLKELDKIIRRVSSNFGWRNKNLLDSSLELWLDGYQEGIPDRKQNIYANGCLVAFAIDLELLQQGSSLTEVMGEAWQRFGKPNIGYDLQTFWKLIQKREGHWDSQTFFRKFIAGNEDILKLLEQLILPFGMKITKSPNEEILTKQLGIILKEGKIQKIHPESPAYFNLMVGDEIVESKIKSSQITLEVKRLNGGQHQLSFDEGGNFFPVVQVKKMEETLLMQKWRK